MKKFILPFNQTALIGGIVFTPSFDANSGNVSIKTNRSKNRVFTDDGDFSHITNGKTTVVNMGCTEGFTAIEVTAVRAPTSPADHVVHGFDQRNEVAA